MGPPVALKLGGPCRSFEIALPHKNSGRQSAGSARHVLVRTFDRAGDNEALVPAIQRGTGRGASVLRLC